MQKSCCGSYNCVDGPLKMIHEILGCHTDGYADCGLLTPNGLVSNYRPTGGKYLFQIYFHPGRWRRYIPPKHW